MAEDIQQQVIALIAAFNAPGRQKKGVVITPETEINTALSLSFSDSNTLMRRYFDTFGVDSSNYNHELYFQPPANTGRWFSLRLQRTPPAAVRVDAGTLRTRQTLAVRHPFPDRAAPLAPHYCSNTSANFASHCGCAGQAGAVTRLPSTCA